MFYGNFGGARELKSDPCFSKVYEWLNDVGDSLEYLQPIDVDWDEVNREIERIVSVWVPVESFANKYTNSFATFWIHKCHDGLYLALRTFHEAVGKEVAARMPGVLYGFETPDEARDYVLTWARIMTLIAHGPPEDEGGWEPAPYKPLSEYPEPGA